MAEIVTIKCPNCGEVGEVDLTIEIDWLCLHCGAELQYDDLAALATSKLQKAKEEEKGGL